MFRIILLIWIRIFVLTVRGSNHDCVQDPSPYPVFGFDWATNPDLCLPLTTVCPRSSDQFYVVNYYINGSLLLGYIVWWRSRIRFPSRVGYGSQPGLQIRVGFIRFRLREKRIRIRSSKKTDVDPVFSPDLTKFRKPDPDPTKLLTKPLYRHLIWTLSQQYIRRRFRNWTASFLLII